MARLLMAFTVIFPFVFAAWVSYRCVYCRPPFMGAISRVYTGLAGAMMVWMSVIPLGMLVTKFDVIRAYEEDQGIDDEGIEIPYEVTHDGVGTNGFNLVFGWMYSVIGLGLAEIFHRIRKRHRGRMIVSKDQALKTRFLNATDPEGEPVAWQGKVPPEL